MSEIRLDQLPAVDIIKQKTPEEILKEIGGENTSAANPEGRIYRGWSLRESYRLRQEDSNAKSLLLAFATGQDLDFIGETYYRNSDGSKILRKPGESDDEYRLALQESPEGLTSAGTIQSYNFHASRAHHLIDKSKVGCYSPEPMVMDAYFISDDESELEIKEAIEEYLVNFVPGGDEFKAVRATPKPYSISGVVKCERGAGVSIIELEGKGYLDEYVAKRTVVRASQSDPVMVSDSWIKECLVMPGVVRVDLGAWSDIECLPNEYPVCESINLTYEVV